jgi:hypothetical protein
MPIRFSKKLQTELSKIKDPQVLLNYLIDYYTHGTSIEHCAKLFKCDEQIIIDTLKKFKVYEFKFCSKCKKLQPFSSFYMNQSMGKNTNRSGVSCQCRNCMSQNCKNYFNNNREHKREYDRLYKRQPSVLLKRLEYQKEYFKNSENKKRINTYMNERYHNNIQQKLHTIISVSINKCLSGRKNNNSINNILNYTMLELKQHLEFQFDNNMNWDNYGTYWEIDHIVPISKFKFNSYDDTDFKNCWSLQNLQPLPCVLNRMKKDKLDESFGNTELAAQFGIL